MSAQNRISRLWSGNRSKSVDWANNRQGGALLPGSSNTLRIGSSLSCRVQLPAWSSRYGAFHGTWKPG